MKEAVDLMREIWPFVVGGIIGAFIGYVVGLTHGREDASSDRTKGEHGG